MSVKPTIVIIDTTTDRGENLSKEWRTRLGHEVVYYNAGNFKLFKSVSDQEPLKAIEVCAMTPELCLFHASDHAQYDSSEHLKSVVNSCQTVVLFSGVGILRGDNRVSAGWFSIPRGISGWHSASDGEWQEFEDWILARSSGSKDLARPVLLSVKTEPHFLIALYILCQGFLAAERMPKRVPSAIAQTRKREWWSVPLLQSVGSNLVNVVTEEWGANVPSSVSSLVEWIAGKSGTDDLDLADIIAKAKLELECRIAK